MKKFKLTVFFILFFSCFGIKLSAEPLYVAVSAKDASNILLSLQKAANNKAKVNLLLDLAYYHLYRTYETKVGFKESLDSTELYGNQARTLSEQLHYTKGILTADLFKGVAYHQQGMDLQALGMYKRILAAAHRAKLFDLEGRTWYEFAILQEKKGRLNSYAQAKACYKKNGDVFRMKYIDRLSELANELTVKGQYFPGYLPINPSNIPSIRQKIDKTESKQDKLDLLLRLASVYIYRQGEEKVHIDSAVLLLNQARALSLELKDKHSYNESMLLKASTYQERNQIGQVHQIIAALTDTSKIKLIINLSDHYWYGMFKVTGKQSTVMLDSTELLNKQALQLGMVLKKPYYIRQAMDRLLRIADWRKYRNPKAPESHYTYIMQNARAAGYPSKARLYGSFCNEYVDRGNFYKGLYYAQLAEENLNDGLTVEDKISVYTGLLSIYKNVENYKKSLVYHKKLIDGADVFGKKILIYSIINSYAECLIAMQLPQEALNYVQQMKIKMPPHIEQASIYYHVALGHCYKALKQYNLAEANYKEAIRYRERQRANPGSLYNDLGNLYALTKNFKLADENIKIAEKYPTTNVTTYMIPYYALKSRIDSAMGNYQSAYKYLGMSKRLSDSIYRVSKDKHTQELEFQYQTQKKESDLRLKDDNIRFLNQNAALLTQTAKIQEARLKEARLLTQKNISDLSLKQKDIDLLNQQAKLQESNLQKQQLQQKVAIGAAAMLLLLTVLIYRLYRIKKNSNKQLESQQLKIEHSNAKLRTLLEEKEWLLKEIHHRVKNNLHTVMSLLESQSAYLENDALEAIRNSQHRIYAMSLIHQKLYLSDDVKAINMAQYIPELIQYLKESFDVKNNVQFNIDLDDIEFDVAEAVPLGLIVNEVITNSLKYAFKPAECGKINVSLKRTAPDLYELIMEDDGEGLPLDFELKTVNSLGMKLIKGLTGQLEADLHIDTFDGTKIIISSLSNNYFKRIKLMESEESW
ncbi:histidine kinase dimerization/phosphoacceptor domain -containing protein [Pedobacter sp. GSP4]|uniref:sensor histidine kinase n=1 Tax=Pedobacter sp. GSP4 TaxID=3453716 RepID=UPI003EEFAE31